MVKENIPAVEIAKEIESELTSEQKAQNQKLILDNLNNCGIDPNGDFFHVNLFSIDFNSYISSPSTFHIHKEEVEDYDKIREEMVKIIINEKDN
jgi:hypothetical protein